MRIRYGLVAIIAVVLMGLVGTHFAANAQDDEDTLELITYVGHVTDNEDEFVAIGTGGGFATVYICDGQPDEGFVSIAEWFFGEISEGDVLDLTNAADIRLQAVITETGATGTFTFPDGTVKAFELELLEGTSGLFRSEFAWGENRFVAGWLVLPDGSVRGAVRDLQTGELTPAEFFSDETDPTLIDTFQE